MIKYHTAVSGIRIAEILHDSGKIADVEDILQLMVDTGYTGNCSGMIIHQDSLPGDFFELKTGIAGEMLQKFSNYRMKLAIIGDFSSIKSKSLNDFIRECNRSSHILFTGSLSEALDHM